jgi:hypothetical protein
MNVQGDILWRDVDLRSQVIRRPNGPS